MLLDIPLDHSVDGFVRSDLIRFPLLVDLFNSSLPLLRGRGFPCHRRRPHHWVVEICEAGRVRAMGVLQAMNEELANRIIDLQAEIAALRGAVRMLLHNTSNADETALAIIREKAFQDDRFEHGIPNERSSRYRKGVREAVASLLDPFQPDSDEASRLNNSAPARTRSPAD